MSTNEDPGELLLLEDILSKVLVHFVDSGLHECRRVCRKWYEVCNKLPVKLSISLDEDRCFDPDQFPNAVSLKLDNEIAWNSAVMKNHLQSLSKLSRIAHLELSIADWPFLPSSPNCSAVFHSLRSFSFSAQTGSAFLDFLETLRCLTDLRALKLDGEMMPYEITGVAPITEIKELRELSARLFFVINNKNEFTFGTQTQLTRLEVLRDDTYSFHPSLILKVTSAPVCQSLWMYSL